MKISEFLTKYSTCPLCGNLLDYQLDFMTPHAFIYSINKLKNNVFIFKKIEELSSGKFYYNPLSLPSTFSITNDIISDNVVSNSQFPLAFLLAECPYKNDFWMYSSSFNIFKSPTDIQVDKDCFQMDWDKIIYNDYYNNITTIRILNKINGSDRSKKIGLIPIDKWPLHDKIKLIDKINKLIALL